MHRLVWPLLLLAGVGIVATPVVHADEKSESLEGRKIADFTLTDYRGTERSLSDYEDAKLVVVAFLGTECPLAKLYAPALQRVSEEFGEKGVVVLGVNANRHDSITEIAVHARDHGLTFPVLKDAGNRVADAFGATRTPEVFVLDADRRVRYHGRVDDRYGVGYARDEARRHDLQIAIEELLAGKPVSVAETPAIGCFIGRIREPKPNAAVTYSNQISRILQKRCVECHREGEIAPFSLTDYDEVVGWAETIAEVIADRRMPPWHASPDYGHFGNDLAMPQEEKELVDQWVRDGAPEGDPATLPETREFVQGWRLPVEPDLVIPMADEPFDVQAEGEVKYQYFVVDPQFTEDKWVRMSEVVPGHRQVVHHVLVLVKPPKSSGRSIDALVGWVAAYVPGSDAGVLPEGMAKRIPAGSKLVFQVHYTPVGTACEDLSKVGFVFADPDEVEYEVKTMAAIERRFRIPAGDENHRVEATWPRGRRSSERAVKLLALMPHMHLRGKSFRYNLVAPDGTETTLLDVPAYDFNWQTRYELAEPMTLPAGSRMHCVAHFDNSAANVWNPDPSTAVGWGDQTDEEMMIGYFDVAVPRR